MTPVEPGSMDQERRALLRVCSDRGEPQGRQHHQPDPLATFSATSQLAEFSLEAFDLPQQIERDGRALEVDPEVPL